MNKTDPKESGGKPMRYKKIGKHRKGWEEIDLSMYPGGSLFTFVGEEGKETWTHSCPPSEKPYV